MKRLTQITGSPFTGKACYLIKGKVVEDFGFPSIEVYKRILYTYVDFTTKTDKNIKRIRKLLLLHPYTRYPLL